MERRLREMPHMMEVSARPWLEEMKVSSLGRIVMAELQQFGDWGFSWLWVMGVWQLGDHGRALDLERARGGEFADVLPHWRAADVVGSPYAVQAPYRLLKTADYDCSQLQALRNRLARVEVRGRGEGPCSCGAVAPPLQGMRLMLDFVPNHTAIDCTSLHLHGSGNGGALALTCQARGCWSSRHSTFTPALVRLLRESSSLEGLSTPTCVWKRL